MIDRKKEGVKIIKSHISQVEIIDASAVLRSLSELQFHFAVNPHAYR